MQDSNDRRSGIHQVVVRDDLAEESERVGNVETDTVTSSVLKWLFRSYESSQKWKGTALEVFLAINGDSDGARCRVANILRTYFIETPLESEVVKQWAEGMSVPQEVKLSPPKVTAASASYIDWMLLADYCLLSCVPQHERITAENLQRDAEFLQLTGTHNILVRVYAARQVMREGIVSDEDVLRRVQEQFPQAAMANVKAARRLEEGGSSLVAPIEPRKHRPMAGYVPLYFRAQSDR